VRLTKREAAEALFPQKGDAPKSAPSPLSNNGAEQSTSETEISASFPDPVSLDEVILPAFPKEIFPSWVNDMVDAVAAATETPRELAAMNALAVLGACCQKIFVVCPHSGYQEPVNIWGMAPMESGNRKTAVMQAMSHPLLDYERRQAEILKPKMAQDESDRKTMEARIQTLRTHAAKSNSGDFGDKQREIAELEKALPEITHLPRLWAQDVTPEKLGQVMADNGEKLALLSDEGGLFDIFGGRYNRGIPNLDLLCQAHAGSAVRVDRGSRPSVFMNHPALTIALSPQPDVLRGLREKPEFRGRGLLARFLYLLPPSPLGHRTLQSTPIPPSVETQYHKGVSALLGIEPPRQENGEENPYILKLNPQAHREWKEFARVVETDMQEGGRFGYLRDWAGKLPGAAVRISGLLHCAEHAHEQPWAEEISLSTMNKALTLAAVLCKHALAAFDLMGEDPVLERSRKAWRWITRTRKATFTVRDCYQALKGGIPRMAELTPALALLKERHYLSDPPAEGSKVGRPSQVFIVNPRLTKDWCL